MQVTRFSVLAVVSWFFLAGQVSADEVRLNGYKFGVPSGFTVELVAQPPLVGYPICADFDEQGRLYVAESSGAKDWKSPQSGETMHRVLRLEDSNGDGKFDQRTVFGK